MIGFMDRQKPTEDEVSKRLRYIANEARKLSISFETGKHDDAAIQMVNLRAAATMAKQDMWDFLGKSE